MSRLLKISITPLCFSLSVSKSYPTGKDSYRSMSNSGSSRADKE